MDIYYYNDEEFSSHTYECYRYFCDMSTVFIKNCSSIMMSDYEYHATFSILL